MPDALAAHVKTHLRFFARNRLVLAAAAVFLLFGGLSIVGSSIWSTAGGHLALVQGIGWTLLSMIRFFVPGLALLLVFAHVRDRTLRVVLTKPHPPELWLLSGLAAVGLVALALHGAVFVLQAALALVWRIPSVMPGLAYAALDGFVRTLVSVGYVTLLVTLFHPVVALLLLSLLNEGSLNGIREMLALQVAASPGGIASWIGERIATAAYYLVPILDPFGSRTGKAVAAFRLTGETWLLLAARAGYALVAFTAFFALAALVFRRKSWN